MTCSHFLTFCFSHMERTQVGMCERKLGGGEEEEGVHERDNVFEKTKTKVLLIRVTAMHDLVPRSGRHDISVKSNVDLGNDRPGRNGHLCK